jgi:ankyrin repeat protein
VNIGGEMEATPLHYAVFSGSIQIVKYLINNGADYNLVDEKNLSPVDYAIDEENIEIIKYFLEKNIEEEKNVKIKSILERNK